jgi:ribosomal protein S18 acetylase RimI-like enzyme
VDGITIRDARPDDCTAMLELWRLAVSGSPVMDTIEHLRVFVERNGDLLLVADLQGQLVGTVLGGWDLWRGHIYRLAVHPEHRKRGIARALLREIVNRLRKRGARRVYALTETEDGLRFWRSTDFEATADATFVRNI